MRRLGRRPVSRWLASGGTLTARLYRLQHPLPRDEQVENLGKILLERRRVGFSPPLPGSHTVPQGWPSGRAQLPIGGLKPTLQFHPPRYASRCRKPTAVGWASAHHCPITMLRCRVGRQAAVQLPIGGLKPTLQADLVRYVKPMPETHARRVGFSPPLPGSHTVPQGRPSGRAQLPIGGLKPTLQAVLVRYVKLLP